MKKIVFLACNFGLVGFCFASSPEIGGFIHSRFSAGKDETNSFTVKRARLKYSGKLDEKFKYKLQIDVLRDPVLLDAVLKYKYSKLFKLSIGQFKIPISAEALTPATKQDLIKKYLFITQMLPSCCRDIGVMAEGVIKKTKYSAGIFNGTGMNKQNDDDKYLYVFRAERDFFSFLKAGISFAGSHETAQGNSKIESALSPPYKKTLFQADIEVKGKKNFLKGELIEARYNPNLSAPLKADGFGLTCGCFLIDRTLSVVLRYEEYDPDTSVTDKNDVKWTTLGINYFALKKVKIQVNYTFKDEKRDETNNNLFVAQMQYCF